MRLKDLLKGINVQNEFDDVEVLGVTQDSRLVKEGSLLYALKVRHLTAIQLQKKCLIKVLLR